MFEDIMPELGESRLVHSNPGLPAVNVLTLMRCKPKAGLSNVSVIHNVT